MLVFEKRGKPEYPGKNLSDQSTEPTNSTHIWRRNRESIPRCHDANDSFHSLSVLSTPLFRLYIQMPIGQESSQILVKAIDDYGLSVAATVNNESIPPQAVSTKNLLIRVDHVSTNSQVMATHNIWGAVCLAKQT